MKNSASSIKLPQLKFPKVQFSPWIVTGVATLALVGASAGLFWWNVIQQQKFIARENMLTMDLELAQGKFDSLQVQLASVSAELDAVKGEDQFKKNRELEAEIRSIQTTYRDAVNTYDSLIKLREDTPKTQPMDSRFSAALTYLSQRNYSSASAQLSLLKQDIQKTVAQLAAASASGVPTNVAVDKNPPANGYKRQAVETDAGTFVVDIIAGDLNSTRVVLETASNSDCKDNCPVDSLASFVGKAGGYAGINGPYFCPAEYPSCAGKTNSFDTLAMNRQKTYFNSDNNVYSVVPVAIFSGNSARFLGQSQSWGRDTGVDAVIASQPMLVSGGNITYGGSGDGKLTSRGSRSFLAAKGNTVYIGVVRGATVGDVAKVLKTLGMDNALNLDSGGSTALMFNGKYLAGPGRNTPFGIVLVRK